LCSAGESAEVGFSRCCHGEVIPRLPLVGRAGTAPPCRLDMCLGGWWVHTSSSTILSSPAMVTGHLGHDL
jgi:hypothetical protein